MTLTSRIVVVLTAIVISVATPLPATAKGILSWLGRLSGPGPFIGIDFSRCVSVNGGKRENGPTGAETDTTQVTSSGAAVIYCPELTQEARYRPHWTFYVVGGVSGSLRNHLQRNGADGHTVLVFNLGGAADYTVAPWFAIGAGGGVDHFVGEDFKGFLRPYVEPYVSIRPALLGKRAGQIPPGSSLMRSLIVSVGWRVLFADLDGASFGAPADPWSGSHNEGRWSLSLGVDLSTLFDK